MSWASNGRTGTNESDHLLVAADGSADDRAPVIRIGLERGLFRSHAALLGSHADLYTGLQGVIAVLAALAHRNRTGEGQYVDVSMAATMLSVNERAGAQLSGIDTKGEPVALSAPESHIFDLPDGRRMTIAASPIYTPMFVRYCAMMRRTDLLTDPRFASAPLRRQNLKALLAEVRAWILMPTSTSCKPR